DTVRMITDYTKALSLSLDAERGIFHGEAELFILDYAPPGQRGYVALTDVLTGWNFRSSKEPTEPIALEISESEGISAETLNKANVFSINGVIYKIVDDGRKAPTYPTKRVWRFYILPSGEAYPPN